MENGDTGAIGEEIQELEIEIARWPEPGRVGPNRLPITNEEIASFRGGTMPIQSSNFFGVLPQAVAEPAPPLDEGMAAEQDGEPEEYRRRRLIRQMIPRESVRRRAVGRVEEEQVVDVPWVDSHLIRLLPDACHLQWDPTLQRDIDPELASFDAPPTRLEKPSDWRPRYSVKIGVVTGRCAPRTQKRGDDTVELVRAGEPVFLRLTSRQPGWEMFDGRGMHVSKDCVRLDPPYRDQEAIEQEMLGMVTRWRDFEEHAEEVFINAARSWRIKRRRDELAIVEHEWDRGNRAIFRPGFNAHHLAEAREYIEQENERDRAGQIPANFIGRPRRHQVGNDEVVEPDEDPEAPAAQENQARQHERRIREAFEKARRANTVRDSTEARKVRQSKTLKNAVRRQLLQLVRHGRSIVRSSSSGSSSAN